ncbi:MAG TPA: sulfite exporter TauE/SafE family protein [Pseudolabrys sp.]|nr:sulfite exporter TauE/SafE family protein [Pseudolabrys sp.]
MINTTDLAAAAIVLLAGLVRGTTGFGGAMLMTPVLSLLIGPVPAVVTALILETVVALIVFPQALPIVNWRTLAFLSVPAAFTVPIGGYFLLTLDPLVARKIIALVVILFSLLLLTGFRYAGKPRAATSIVLGSVVGVLLGATSVGAPPVILYLLSGPDPAAVTRANLTVFVTAISIFGLIMLAATGAIRTAHLPMLIALSAVYIAATWLGGKLFARLTDNGARRIALGFMLLIGIATLVA